MHKYEVSFRVHDPECIMQTFGLGLQMKTKFVKLAVAHWASAEPCARARLPASQHNAVCTGIREV